MVDMSVQPFPGVLEYSAIPKMAVPPAVAGDDGNGGSTGGNGGDDGDGGGSGGAVVPYWLAPQLQPMLQLLSHSALWALHPSSQLSVPELSSQLSLHV